MKMVKMPFVLPKILNIVCDGIDQIVTSVDW